MTRRKRGEVSCYQRKDGSWVAQFMGKYRYAKHEESAKRKLYAMLSSAEVDLPRFGGSSENLMKRSRGLYGQEVRFLSSRRRVRAASTQRTYRARTSNASLKLELVDPALGLSLAVGQGHRSHHRLSVLKQLDGESLQFGNTGRFGSLCPLLQA